VAFDQDAAARVAILTGSGGTFCAGADLKAMDNPMHPHGMGPMGCSRLSLTKPVIAAISGFAVAGGLELALWCDLRVAEMDATFGVFCRRFGVPLIDGGTVRLPRLIGESRAMDIILTGRPVSASEALDIGLVNRLVSKGESLIAAEGLALELSELPQATMLSDRASVKEQFGMDSRSAMHNEFAYGTAVMNEAHKGALKFVQRVGRTKVSKL